MKRLPTWCIPLFLLIPGAQAQEVISNGTFDTDITGWQEAVPTSSGTLEWSPSLGLPPGALRIVGEDQSAATVDCFATVSAGLEITSDAFMETNGEFVGCSVDFHFFDSSDGSGAPQVSSPPPLFVSSPNQWESLSRTLSNALPGTLSFRPTLAKTGDSMGDDACLFDNVSAMILLGTLSGRIFEDRNGNGLQDPEEPGLAGVEALITDSDSGTQIVTTDADGDYGASVPPGSTTVDVDESSLPANAVLTAGTDPITVTVVAGANTMVEPHGYQIPSTVEIPTLQSVGLLFLALGLGIPGAYLAGRRRKGIDHRPTRE